MTILMCYTPINVVRERRECQVLSKRCRNHRGFRPTAVFVGSGIFKSDNPEKRGKAIVSATTHYQDASIVAEASRGLGAAMKGIQAQDIPEEELLQTR